MLQRTAWKQPGLHTCSQEANVTMHGRELSIRSLGVLSIQVKTKQAGSRLRSAFCVSGPHAYFCSPIAPSDSPPGSHWHMLSTQIAWLQSEGVGRYNSGQKIRLCMPLKKGKLLRIWQNLRWLCLGICQLFAGLSLVSFSLIRGIWLKTSKRHLTERRMILNTKQTWYCQSFKVRGLNCEHF